MSTCECPQHGKWYSAEDIDRLTLELDIAWNGKDGAAERPMLCDVAGQIIEELTRTDRVSERRRTRCMCGKCDVHPAQGGVF